MYLYHPGKITLKVKLRHRGFLAAFGYPVLTIQRPKANWIRAAHFRIYSSQIPPFKYGQH
jgi:hypothetical protein